MRLNIKNDRFTVLTEHLTTKILTSVDKLEEIKDDWNKLFNSCNNLSAFQTYTWNYVWWQHYGKGMQLSIFTVRENNSLVGIAPFMVKSRFGVRELEPIGGEHHYNFDFIMDSRRDDVASAIALKIADSFPKGLVHIPYYAAGTNSIDIFMAALNTKGGKRRDGPGIFLITFLKVMGSIVTWHANQKSRAIISNVNGRDSMKLV